MALLGLTVYELLTVYDSRDAHRYPKCQLSISCGRVRLFSPHLTDVRPMMARHWTNPVATPAHIDRVSPCVAFAVMRGGIA